MTRIRTKVLTHCSPPPPRRCRGGRCRRRGPGEGRHGICRNMSGHGHWARCNKNFDENRTIRFYAVKYTGETNSFSDTSEWESSSTGPAN